MKNTHTTPYHSNVTSHTTPQNNARSHTTQHTSKMSHTNTNNNNVTSHTTPQFVSKNSRTTPQHSNSSKLPTPHHNNKTGHTTPHENTNSHTTQINSNINTNNTSNRTTPRNSNTHHNNHPNNYKTPNTINMGHDQSKHKCHTTPSHNVTSHTTPIHQAHTMSTVTPNTTRDILPEGMTFLQLVFKNRLGLCMVWTLASLLSCLFPYASLIQRKQHLLIPWIILDDSMLWNQSFGFDEALLSCDEDVLSGEKENNNHNKHPTRFVLAISDHLS